MVARATLLQRFGHVATEAVARRQRLAVVSKAQDDESAAAADQDTGEPFEGHA